MRSHFSSRTPLRISFLGGGADFEQRILKRDRFICGMSINYYTYMNAYLMPSIYKNRIRIQYSKVEEVDKPSEIEHRAFREIFKYKNINNINLSVASDMPSGSGLGSSSSFTVGLLNILNCLNNNLYDNQQLADEAIYIEQHLLAENCGIQDQILCSLGGLRMIQLTPSGFIDRSSLLDRDSLYKRLAEESFLVFTGILRKSSEFQQQSDLHIEKELITDQISDISEYFYDQLAHCSDQYELLKDCIMNTWALKSKISGLTNDSGFLELLDSVKSTGCKHFKLLGAGGGGFIFCLVPLSIQDIFLKKLGSKAYRVSPEARGSQSYSISL